MCKFVNRIDNRCNIMWHLIKHIFKNEKLKEYEKIYD